MCLCACSSHNSSENWTGTSDFGCSIRKILRWYIKYKQKRSTRKGSGIGFLPYGVMTDLRHTTVAMVTSNVTPGLLLLRHTVLSVRDALRSIMETVHVCCVGKALRLNTKLSFENIMQHITTDYSTASFVGRCSICSSNQALTSSHSCHLFFICCITYLLTYSMVHSPSWEANCFAASQEIPRISRNPKVHYRTHKRPPPYVVLHLYSRSSAVYSASDPSPHNTRALSPL